MPGLFLARANGLECLQPNSTGTCLHWHVPRCSGVLPCAHALCILLCCASSWPAPRDSVIGACRNCQTDTWYWHVRAHSRWVLRLAILRLSLLLTLPPQPAVFVWIGQYLEECDYSDDAACDTFALHAVLALVPASLFLSFPLLSCCTCRAAAAACPASAVTL